MLCTEKLISGEVSTSCGVRTCDLLAKEIFEDIKWWIIIVLSVSPCKSVFCNYQRGVYIPLSSRSPVTNVFALFRPAGVRSCIYFHNPAAYGKFTKDLKWLLKQLGLGTGYSSHSFRRGGASFYEIIKLINS